MRNIILFLGVISCFVVGCSYLQSGTLSVSVENQGKPIDKSIITLYSISETTQKERLLSQQATGKNGIIKWNIDFSNIRNIKVTVQNGGLEKIYLPDVKYVQAPKWWQEHDVVLKVNLAEFNPKNLKTIKSVETNKVPITESESFLDFPEDPISQSISIAQIEFNLLPESNLQSNGSAFHIVNKSQEDKLGLSENINTKNSLKSDSNTITENKNILFEDALALEIFFEGKPQENVHVFTGRNASQNISYIGTTDGKGIISFPMPKQRRADVLILKKASFLTVVKPLTSGSGKQSMRIDLQEGKSTDFILQSYAYGVGRGIDKTELKANSLRIDISGLTGFVTTSKPLDDKTLLSLNQKNSIPEIIDFKILKKCIELHSLVNQIPTLYVSALLPYKPSVGLIEPSLSSPLQTNQQWRRVRREFFSRFMNEPFMRGLISEDIIKMSNSIGISPIEMAKSGWKNTAFSSDLDLLMQIQYIEAENGKDFLLGGKVFDKSGKVIMERTMPVTMENSEKISAKMYSSLLSSLPIEGGIVKKNNNEVTINLGKNFGLLEGDSFVAFIQKYPFSPPEKPIGVIKVKSVGEKDSLADIIIGQERLQKSDVIRVIRYPEKIIQQDLQSQIASSL